ncbi:sensor histidine kinase [Sphaerisporangium sp. TRM90804]|uniref:sensor histidine kinase n=1 Tax=Sphaerisporangium sp. TRM90804 TaxID=3031113 RepID=UPI00244C0B68|nr:sensor histidine kinase [Sphaerisporangium sp. TRM90804]MDH2424354.1 sensor domain-containing protein [Sphaerisporangium sp. TRM90804]
MAEVLPQQIPRGPAAAGTAWLALAGHPLRFLGSWWPWRSLAYLLSGVVVAALWLAGVLALMCVPAAGVLVLLAGIPLSGVERRRLRLVDRAPALSTHRRPGRRGAWAWFGTRLRETGTWRELGYGLLFSFGLAWVDFAVAALVLCAVYMAGLPFVLLLTPPEYLPLEVLWLDVADGPGAALVSAAGLVVLPVVLYLATAYAAGRAAMTRSMLARRPDESLRAEMVELSRSRARILGASDAQRRRIERDLHDGAQQRLTGLIMTLGLTRLELSGAPPAARDLVERAYGEANQALTELRDLVRGIHPHVLTDRGLAPALDELAERCAVPVDVDVRAPGRVPEPVEAAAWFVVAEALTNVARHSRATGARVTVEHGDGRLVVEVADDGVGGADAAGGTGLLGLADRVSVLDGRIMLSSPQGGPTVLRVELPCAS